MYMQYVMFAFILALVLAPIVNVNQELLSLDEIDKIFNNLTPDSMGGKDNSSLIMPGISNSFH